MNYIDLANQYGHQYKTLSAYVGNLRSQIKKSETFQAELTSRIRILYAICLDLKHTGEYLKKCERREMYAEKQSAI